MAIVTQFCFEPDPVIAWVDKLAALGITLPVHIGIAGPAKLQTLVKFAIACGVGPSLRVLQRRARDVTKLFIAVRAGRNGRGAGGAQGRKPRIWHRIGAFLPAWGHQDRGHMGGGAHKRRDRMTRTVLESKSKTVDHRL